jgi:catechol 2,3-dioxygenase
VSGILPANTGIGRVRLQVASVARSLDFYRGLLGLEAREVAGGETTLLTPDGRELVRLRERPDAVAKPRATTGLYHFAILVPDRGALAAVYLRLHGGGWPFHGFADHLVSEALYLADPDGNGIEIYADRPRDDWQHTHGEVRMTTAPLDLRGLLSELEQPTPAKGGAGLPGGTLIGHIHLHVANLDRAESFYGGVLGFEATARSYPGALFMSAGGYHHHVGLNVWAGAGAPPPPENAVGLLDFAIVVPDGDARAEIAERARRDDRPVRDDGDVTRITSPDGLPVLVTAG